MDNLSRADGAENKGNSSGNESYNETSSNRDSLTESATTSNPTENELIDLDDIELSDEDTWLYTSPNKNSGNKEINPYKWLRKDVEDPTNLGLQIAKTALVCKLDELEILGSHPRDQVSTSKPKDLNLSIKKSNLVDNCDIFANKNTSTIKNGSPNSSVSKGNGHLFKSSHESDRNTDSKNKYHQPLTQTCSDVTDILERARRQEESLKASSSKFFSQAARTIPKGVLPTGHSRSKLQKPSSIEALHACNGEQNASILSPSKATHRVPLSSPNHSPFGSTASLDLPNEIHRGSLPNLNKGYYSLQKKPKRGSESLIQCPLPIYPKSTINVANREATRRPLGKGIPKSPSVTESQTLPSSYRTKTKTPAHLNGGFSSTMLRRDSATSINGQRNPMQGSRRGSSTNVFHSDALPDGKRNMIHMSPRKNSAPMAHNFAASPLSLESSRTVSLNPLSPESQSPMKRQPLSSVHNCSTEQEDSSFHQKNGERRKSSLPSKIPSPASRSGIPVPSQATLRSNLPNNGWDRNVY